MSESELIQNAFYVPEDDTYFVSRHQHDFVRWISKDGKADWATDGGLAYLRILASDWNLEGTRVFDWCLTTKSPVKEIREKLLWGSFGIDGDQTVPIFRPISTLSLDHLRAILKTQPHIKGTMQEKVVRYWMKVKDEKEKKKGKAKKSDKR